MKIFKLIIITAILFLSFSCSNDTVDFTDETTQTEENESISRSDLNRIKRILQSRTFGLNNQYFTSKYNKATRMTSGNRLSGLRFSYNRGSNSIGTVTGRYRSGYTGTIKTIRRGKFKVHSNHKIVLNGTRFWTQINGYIAQHGIKTSIYQKDRFLFREIISLKYLHL